MLSINNIFIGIVSSSSSPLVKVANDQEQCRARRGQHQHCHRCRQSHHQHHYLHLKKRQPVVKSSVEGGVVGDGEAKKEDVGCKKLGRGTQFLQITGKYNYEYHDHNHHNRIQVNYLACWVLFWSSSTSKEPQNWQLGPNMAPCGCPRTSRGAKGAHFG